MSAYDPLRTFGRSNLTLPAGHGAEYAFRGTPQRVWLYSGLVCRLLWPYQGSGDDAVPCDATSVLPRGSRLIKGPPPESLQHIQQSCSWRRYEPGEPIVEYLDRSNDVYFLISGEARALVYSLAGKVVSFRDLAPGDTFGEYPAIDGHTGQVVVGNIGSSERTKYGVVGSNVNLTSRIQSYTTGGQILISETTRKEVGPILKIGKQMEIKAKGVKHPITLAEILGIEEPHKLSLPQTAEALVPLTQAISFKYAIVEGAHLSEGMFRGRLMKLSARAAEAHLEGPVPTLSNLEMHFIGTEGQEIPGTLYGKVVQTMGSNTDCYIRFTSISPEIETFLGGLLAAGAEAGAEGAGPRPRSPERILRVV